MALTVDQILERIGSLGFYQIRLIFILGYIQWFNITFQVMVPTFIAAEPKWLCVANHSACNLTGELNREINFITSDVICRERHGRLLMFDLVCDKALLGTISTSLLFAGWLIGALLGGVLSDKIGRKPVLFVFSIVCSLFALLAAFPNVFWLFMVFRLLVGICIGGGAMSIFVLATEFTGVKHRHVAGTALWYSWALGLVMLGGLAYGIRDWRYLFTPESSRYLLVKGKVTETEEILRRIASTNKKEYPEEPLLNPNADGKVQNLGDFRDLFRTKKMLHRTLVSWYAWLVNGMVYYGVSFSTPTLGGNMYLNFFLSSVIEIPANYAGIWAMGKFGRKRTLIYFLILAAIASSGAVLFTMYDPGDDKCYAAGRIIMALSAKNVGMGTSTSAARVGSFCSPYIVHLTRVHPLLPYGIMGSQALMASLLCMTLPETRGMPTAEIMDSEAEGAELGVLNISMEDEEVKDGKEKEKSEEKEKEKNEATTGEVNGDVMSSRANLIDENNSINTAC
ncbi:hypothetical protein OS493_016191 [Desmophyllum pertusum]|uniref:Major facilitator superfamily (MFS) profile domain-containing protein n=1 Tax=Desmophyllum pertusum TaxID=174260 RepID=A0A9X0A2J0_9CNID|nr:hypothetical protein OS493_016191 [Desmophyllum pertusum]